jgi:excisionase family DNA binding protein
MKTTQNVPYFSTSQVARILGLSVGTVQRMVENGVFKAFVTQGGHRRILASSLSRFCSEQGFASPDLPHSKPLICILHDSAHVDEALVRMSQWPGIKVITHPLDLMGLHDSISALFIDARIGWLHDAPLHLQGNMADNAQVIAYNCTQMPTLSALHDTPAITLIDSDIGADLVRGYQLGLQHSLHASSPQNPATPQRPGRGASQTRVHQ